MCVQCSCSCISSQFSMFPQTQCSHKLILLQKDFNSKLKLISAIYGEWINKLKEHSFTNKNKKKETIFNWNDSLYSISK